MKFIDKESAPGDFLHWLDSGNENWQPAWENFQSPEKESVRKSLFEEQHGLCCYCETKITCNYDKVHIEHLFPQSLHPDKSLDYENMLLSCNCLLAEDDDRPCHCGRYKEDKNPVEMISPLDPDCELHFMYTFDGVMHPRTEDDGKARTTVDYLGLNTPSLKRARNSIFDILFAEDKPLTKKQIANFVETKLALREDGTYVPYWTVWHQLESY